jgi:hypothetical protein
MGQKIPVALISVALAGSILGFLKYNFNPASIFLGDSGAYFLGFILSALSLLGSAKGTTTVALLIPILCLGIPIMDILVSTVRRLLKTFHIVQIDRRHKKIRFLYSEAGSLFQADADHIHHRLLQMGLNQKKAVTVLYFASCILGLTALATVYFQSVNYVFLLIAIGLATFIFLEKLGYKVRLLKNGSLLPLYDVSPLNGTLVRVLLEMAFIVFAYYLAFLLKYEGVFSLPLREYFLMTAPMVLVVKLGVFITFKMFHGHWRNAGIEGVVITAKAVFIGSIASGFLLWVIPPLGVRNWSVLAIDFLLLLFLILAGRYSFQILEHLYISKNGQTSYNNIQSQTVSSPQGGGASGKS